MFSNLRPYLSILLCCFISLSLNAQTSKLSHTIKDATFSVQIPSNYNYKESGHVPDAFYIYPKSLAGATKLDKKASQLWFRSIQLVPAGKTELTKRKWNERVRMKEYADQYGRHSRKIKSDEKFRKDNSGKLGRVWAKTFEERNAISKGEFKTDYRFHAEWRIFTKKYCYLITYDVKDLNEEQLQAVQKIFYSIKLEKVKGEDLAADDCTDGKTKLLKDQAIVTTFFLPHPTKEPFFIQKPTLPKDASVPASWAFFTDFCISAIQAGGIVKDGMSSISDLKNKDFLSAAASLAGWSEKDAIVGALFNPEAHRKAKAEDMTSVVSFYLVALRAAANGATAIGQKMNKSASDYYYEVPYMAVEAKCIPQMICKNGKWEPDYSAPVYMEIKDSVMGKWSKKDMAQTPRQIARIYEKEFEKYINRCAEDSRFYKLDNKCYKSMDEFMNIKWPGQGYDVCAQFKAQRVIEKSVLIQEESQKKKLDAEYKAWITNGGRDAEIKKLKNRVIQLNKEQAIANNAIKAKNVAIDNINDYLNKNFTTPALRASATYKAKEAEIAKLKKDKIALGKKLISVANEKDLIAYQQEQLRLEVKKKQLEKELAEVKDSIKDAKAALKKTNQVLRDKKCK